MTIKDHCCRPVCSGKVQGEVPCAMTWRMKDKGRKGAEDSRGILCEDPREENRIV